MKWLMPGTPYDYENATDNEEQIESRPSGHSIIHHLWEPSFYELKYGIFNGFGATIASLAGIEECGKTKNVKANLR